MRARSVHWKSVSEHLEYYMDHIHILVGFLQGPTISGQSCFYHLWSKAHWYEAEETLLYFGMPCVLCSVGKSLSDYHSSLLNWLKLFKCESKSLVEKKPSLWLLKTKRLFCLTMKGYGCQGKAVAGQPDGSTGGKEEERKQLMLKSAV